MQRPGRKSQAGEPSTALRPLLNSIAPDRGAPHRREAGARGPSSSTTGVGLVADALRAAFGAGFHVRQGSPLALGTWSEPEPDVCVIRGSPRDYRDAHPTRPVLVVEVSYSRLRFDRTRKAAIYARRRIADYWIVDIVGRALEVHREPAQSAARPRRWRYRSVERLSADASVTPLAAPGARVSVADLLP